MQLLWTGTTHQATTVTGINNYNIIPNTHAINMICKIITWQHQNYSDIVRLSSGLEINVDTLAHDVLIGKSKTATYEEMMELEGKK